MGKKRPWCERATTKQDFVTVNEQQSWTHSSGMFLGGLIQLGVYAGGFGLHAALGVLLFNWTFIQDRKPEDPGFLASALPVWGIAMVLLIGAFLGSLLFSLPAKSRMKRALLPIRCQRCPKCFYDLSQRPRDDEICPECGVVAPRRECVRLWCKLLRTRF